LARLQGDGVLNKRALLTCNKTHTKDLKLLDRGDSAQLEVKDLKETTMSIQKIVSIDLKSKCKFDRTKGNHLDQSKNIYLKIVQICHLWNNSNLKLGSGTRKIQKWILICYTLVKCLHSTRRTKTKRNKLQKARGNRLDHLHEERKRKFDQLFARSLANRVMQTFSSGWTTQTL
jgi:hypothetical protein